jgi:hypothetical protein
VSRFVTPLRIERIEDKSGDGRGTWRLLAPLLYDSALAGMLVAPTGFVTDLASVPRAPFAYLLAGGIGHAAAVIHDWLYCCHRLTRARADAVFYEALLALGVPRWRAWLMWAGVRIGGAHPWRASGQRQPELVASWIDAIHPDGP